MSDETKDPPSDARTQPGRLVAIFRAECEDAESRVVQAVGTPIAAMIRGMGLRIVHENFIGGFEAVLAGMDKRSASDGK